MFFFYSENIWSSSTRLEEEIFPKSNQQKYRFFCRVLFFSILFQTNRSTKKEKKRYKAGGVSCQLRNTIVKQRWESWRKTTKKTNQRDKMMDFRIFSKPTKEQQQPTYIYKKEATKRNQIYITPVHNLPHIHGCVSFTYSIVSSTCLFALPRPSLCLSQGEFFFSFIF